MNAIVEISPSITDTRQDRDQMIKDAQEFTEAGMEADDFMVFPTEKSENELFEESSTIFTIDGKDKEFTYISSFKKGSDLYSFGQDALGLWWYFDRCGIASGKNLHGPYRTKEKLLAAMENIHA